MRALSPDEFRAHALPWYEKAGVASWKLNILDRILQPRVEYFSQIPDMLRFLVEQPSYSLDLYTNKKSKVNPDISRQIIGEALPILEALPDWEEETLHNALIGWAAETGRKNGTVLYPLRIALSGQAVTPGGAIEIAALLGREESFRRLKEGLPSWAEIEHTP